MCLLLPWAIFEARPLFNDSSVRIDVPIFVSNAAAAFGLNMSVFLLIGKTSALAMNVRASLSIWLLLRIVLQPSACCISARRLPQAASLIAPLSQLSLSCKAVQIAGVVKDWMLIGLSVVLFHAEVRTQLLMATASC